MRSSHAFPVALVLPAALLLAGCTYAEETFEADYLAAYCDLLTRCEAEALSYLEGRGMDGATAQAEVDEWYGQSCPTPTPDTGAEGECTYDGKKAKACVAELGEVACDAALDHGFALPATCNEVYVCVAKDPPADTQDPADTGDSSATAR